MPFVPGGEFSGVVVGDTGGDAALDDGAPVYGWPGMTGCYAQYVCLPQRSLVPVPAGLDPAEAVALVLNYITAYQMLHRSAKGQPGQRMLQPSTASPSVVPGHA